MNRPPRSLSRSKPLTQLPPEPPAPATPRRRDRRPWIYAAIDLVLVVVHSLIITQAMPTRHLSGQVLMGSIVGAFAVAGGATLIGRRQTYWIAAAACGFLLALEVVLLVVMVYSAAYLAGVFGAFGRGAAGMTLAAAALSLQLVALVPAFQLRYLLGRAGRRAFGRAGAA